MKTVAIIMAGGAGERFWPLSRRAYPKQLLKLDNNRNMLSSSVLRIQSLVSPEDIYIVTVASLKEAICREITEIPRENILTEPEGRNTAAVLTFASAFLTSKYGDDCVTVVLTADHFIHDVDAFSHDCAAAIEHARENDALVTFGIRPARPDTGYGYIEVGAPASRRDPIFSVKAFREKPDPGTARRFLEHGGFYWNSGMFVWRNSVFQAGLAVHLPAMHDAITPMVEAFRSGNHKEILPGIYSDFEKISIDVGLLEASQNVYMIRASFDWDDIGSWTALYRVLDRDSAGNASYGNALFLKSEDCLSYAPCAASTDCPDKLVVLYNLHGVVVVNTADAMLVLPAEDVQQVKDVVAYLRENGMEGYL